MHYKQTSFCLYVIIKQTWRVKAVILKQIKFICPFEIYMEISFSHSSRGDVNGPQRAGTVLMVYSGELEHCKDICRSEMRLIDREVCEDRKNVHSACQWVELSVLHLATVFVEQTRQDFFVSWKGKKKQEESSWDNNIVWKEWCFVVLFQGTHMYTPTVQSPQSGSLLLPLCLLSAAELCRTGPTLAFPQVFFKPMLECIGLILHE